MRTYDILIRGFDSNGAVVCEKRVYPSEMPTLEDLAKHMPTNAIRMTANFDLPMELKIPSIFGRR